MRKDLLLRLADLLEADAKKPDGIKFDLAAWAYDANNGNSLHNGLTPGVTVPLNCNTAACAMGLAALSGVFKEDGLGYEINRIGDLLPICGEARGYEAAEKLFEISDEAAEYLFYGNSYPKDKRTGANAELFVAKRVRQYVDTDDVTPD